MINLCSSPTQQSEIRDMLAASRFADLAAIASDRIGCPVDPDLLAARCEQFREVGHRRWSDSTYRHWILCRAVEVATQRWLGELESAAGFTCELHVFSITFEETDEHLARLRGESLSPLTSQVARSKLTREQPALVRPINKTAHNVAPFPSDR